MQRSVSLLPFIGFHRIKHRFLFFAWRFFAVDYTVLTEDVNRVLVVRSILLLLRSFIGSHRWISSLRIGRRSAVEKLLAVTFLPVIYKWLPQGHLSEFRVQTLDNTYYELIGYSIYLCHGRWTDCHISATSSQESSLVTMCSKLQKRFSFNIKHMKRSESASIAPEESVLLMVQWWARGHIFLIFACKQMWQNLLFMHITIGAQVITPTRNMCP